MTDESGRRKRFRLRGRTCGLRHSCSCPPAMNLPAFGNGRARLLWIPCCLLRHGACTQHTWHGHILSPNVPTRLQSRHDHAKHSRLGASPTQVFLTPYSLSYGRSGLRPSLVRGDTPRNAPLQNHASLPPRCSPAPYPLPFPPSALDRSPTILKIPKKSCKSCFRHPPKKFPRLTDPP